MGSSKDESAEFKKRIYYNSAREYFQFIEGFFKITSEYIFLNNER